MVHVVTTSRLHPAIQYAVDADGASRRTFLRRGAALLGLTVTGFSADRASAQESTPTAIVTECVLTGELTEGPYYLDGQLVRSDITEGLPGVPLTLRIGVQDIASCGQLVDAAVEIWHCDAQGFYSGIAGADPEGGSEAAGDDNADTTFLRGIQLTDADGIATFETVYPGWYSGRTVHIHMMVHVDGEIVNVTEDPDVSSSVTRGETYAGERTVHTGQLFFDDALSEEVFLTEAYLRSSEEGLITNDDDGIFGDHGDEPGFLVEWSGSAEAGIVGTILVGVDSTATSGQGMGGGGQGGGSAGPPSDD